MHDPAVPALHFKESLWYIVYGHYSIVPSCYKVCSVVSTGELMTTASWIRKQVQSHPDYKHNSVVSDKVTYDLVQLMDGVTEGTVPCPDLVGSLSSKAPKTYSVLDCPP